MKDITAYKLFVGAACTDIGVAVSLILASFKIWGTLTLAWLWVAAPTLLPIIVTLLAVSLDYLPRVIDLVRKN